MSDSLVKIDVEHRTSKVFQPENDSICSEPIFVASPGARVEDDGVLLSIVMNSKIRKSLLTVVDAKEMVEIGRAQYVFCVDLTNKCDVLTIITGFHVLWAMAFMVPTLRAERSLGRLLQVHEVRDGSWCEEATFFLWPDSSSSLAAPNRYGLCRVLRP